MMIMITWSIMKVSSNKSYNMDMVDKYFRMEVITLDTSSIMRKKTKGVSSLIRVKRTLSLSLVILSLINLMDYAK